MKYLFIFLVATVLSACDSGPTVSGGGTPTITVECESGVCDGRPAVKITIDWPDSTTNVFLICCKDIEVFMDELGKAKKKACEDNDFSTGPVNAGGVEISPYESTTTGEKGVRLKKGSDDVLIVCSQLDELIQKINAILPSCCIM